MQETINQLVSVIRNGAIMGGAYSEADKATAILYYYKDGDFYMGNAANGGPSPMDETLPESELRRRFEAHFNTMSDDEFKEDAARILMIYNSTQAKAIGELPPKTMQAIPNHVEKAQAIQEEMHGGVTIPRSEAYALLHLLDDVSAEMWIEDGGYDDARAALRRLYKSLPVHQQKDIQELDIYDVIQE